MSKGSLEPRAPVKPVHQEPAVGDFVQPTGERISAPPSARAYRSDRISQTEGSAANSISARQSRYSERAPVAVRAGDAPETPLPSLADATAVDGLPLECPRDTARGLAPPSHPPAPISDADNWFDSDSTIDSSMRTDDVATPSCSAELPPESVARPTTESGRVAGTRVQWLSIPEALRAAARRAIRGSATRRDTVKGLGEPRDESASSRAESEGAGMAASVMQSEEFRSRSFSDPNAEHSMASADEAFDSRSVRVSQSDWIPDELPLTHSGSWRLVLVAMTCAVALIVLGAAWFVQRQRVHTTGPLPSVIDARSAPVAEDSNADGRLRTGPAQGSAVSTQSVQVDAHAPARSENIEPGSTGGEPRPAPRLTPRRIGDARTAGKGSLLPSHRLQKASGSANSQPQRVPEQARPTKDEQVPDDLIF